MPAVMMLKCDKCEYKKVTSQSSCYLTLSDGEELVLEHPAEEIQAFRATGKHLNELFKEGRIKCKYGLVCITCGEWDLYSISKEQSTSGYIGLLVARARDKDLENISCKYCGKNTLRSVMGSQVGCLFAFIKLIFLKKDYFPCPKCGKGKIKFDITGIS